MPARYTTEEGLEFIRRQHDRLSSGQGVSLAIAREPADEAIGLVILQSRPQQGVAGIGYWLVPDARRRGFGARAVRLATDWGLGQAGFERVEAWVEPGNIASQRTLEANGYLREGLLRSFLVLGKRRSDALVYSQIRDENG